MKIEYAMHSFQKTLGNGGNKTTKNEIGKFHEFYGKRLGRFLIEREIGDGGTGTVHQARDTLSGQLVAIKTASGRKMDLHQAESFLEREERALGLLDHPHIVKLLASGLQDGKRYIVTEYLDAPCIGNMVTFANPMPWKRARAILLQVCSALAAVHEKGMVHSDVKAYHIFLAGLPDKFDWAKLFDFGLVKFMGAKSNGTRSPNGFVLGTSTYMAPEQSYGEDFDHRADIYSMGILTYAMVCGALPFEADTPGEIIMMHRFDYATPLRERRPDLGINPKVEAIVLRAMEKEPSSRFQSMAEMGEAIEKTE